MVGYVQGYIAGWPAHDPWGAHVADEDTQDRHDPLDKLPKWPWLLAFIGFGLFAEAANNTIGMFGTIGDAVVAVADWLTPFGDGSDGDGDGGSAAPSPSPSTGPAPTTTNRPRRPGARDPVAVEGAPVALATDGESVWVVAADGDEGGGGTLTRLTAAGHAEHVLQLAGEPHDVAYAAGSVFVSLGDLGTVRYDAVRLGEQDEITSGEGGETQGRHVGVAAGDDGQVWLLTAGGSTGEVYRIDPATGDVVHVGGLEARPSRIAAGRAGAYVLLGESDVTRLRVTSDGGVERDPPVGVGERPTGLAVGRDHVWVTRADGQVTRFDLDLSEPIDRAPLDGAGAAGVAVAGLQTGADDPWLLDAAGDRAVQVDDRTLAGIDAAAIDVGGDPVDVVATDDALWIATSSPGQVVRIALP